MMNGQEMLINQREVEEVLKKIGFNLETDKVRLCGKTSVIKRLNWELNDLKAKGNNDEAIQKKVKDIHNAYKIPISSGGKTIDLPYKKAIQQIREGSAARIGLILPKGYFIVDTDEAEESAKMFNWLETNHIETCIFSTKKGYHFLFKHPFDSPEALQKETGINNRAKAVLTNGVVADFRVEGRGYIILPTNDKERGVYRISENIADFHEGLCVPNSKKTDKKIIKAVNKSELIEEDQEIWNEGCRDDRITKECGILVKKYFNIGYEAILNMALGINAKRCNPPLDEAVVKDKVQRFYANEVELKKVQSDIPDYIDATFKDGKITSIKLIPDVLRERIQNDCKLIYHMHVFYKHNGRFYEEISTQDLKCVIKEYLKDYPKLRRKNSIDEVVDLLKDECYRKDLDLDYISLENGVLNLKDMKLFPYTSPGVYDIFSNHYLPFIWDEKRLEKDIFETEAFQTSSFYSKYLLPTFRENTDLIRNIQEIFGLCLRNEPQKFQKAICCLGSGSNGKSLLFSIISHLVGESNVSRVEMKTIFSEDPGFGLTELPGKRVNIDTDASGTRQKESGIFKNITAGDPITIRKKYEENIKGNINSLLIYGLNKIPSTADTSDGFWRRIEIIPFDVRFYSEEDLNNGFTIKEYDKKKDIHLLDEILSKEMEIVFWFAIQGLIRIRKNNYKLTKCAARKDLTYDTILDKDTVREFNIYRLTGDVVVPKVNASKLYEIYKDWCEENEKEACTSTRFGSRIKEVNRMEKGKDFVKDNVIKYKNFKLPLEIVRKYQLTPESVF